MKYNEKRGNLFNLAGEYVLWHCISLDCEMGKGIAVQFVNRYPEMKNTLRVMIKEKNLTFPVTILYKDKPTGELVLNLITKERFFHKPSKDTIREGIRQMSKICKDEGIYKLALPQIGCGLDRLNWKDVSDMLKQEFAEQQIEIQIRWI